jgi:nucleoside phosphorylase
MNTPSSPSTPLILVCAATEEELAAFGLPEHAETVHENALKNFRGAVTGVGVPHTLLRLVPLLERLHPKLVVNIGIAGAYPHCDPLRDAPRAPSSENAVDTELRIGEVVAGHSEVFADLGMEIPDEERFRPLGAFPFADPGLRAPLPLYVPDWLVSAGVRAGRGATVNACTGTLATGALRRRLFDADFESMEGAAVALACREKNVPCLEIRAISNRAARRELRPENIRLALDALRAFWESNRDRLRAP